MKTVKDDSREGFDLPLAALDSVPVIFFGASAAQAADFIDDPLFTAGTQLSALAGACKVTWKFAIALGYGDIKPLNAAFVPLQCAGMGMAAYSAYKNRAKIKEGELLKKASAFPAVIYFSAGAALMTCMGVLASHFDDSAGSNYKAEAVNSCAQAMIWLGIRSMDRER